MIFIRIVCDIGILVLINFMITKCDSVLQVKMDQHAEYGKDPSPKQVPDEYISKLMEYYNSIPKSKNNPNVLLNKFKNLEEKKSELTKILQRKLSDEMASRNLDLVLMMQPEFENEFKHLIINSQSNKTNYLKSHGSTSCTLDKTALSTNSDYTVKICPWHYESYYRKDKFPHLRISVKCNCENCLGKQRSKFSQEYFNSYCKPVYSLMPVLVKLKPNDYKLSNWHFKLEQVATSCVCTLSLGPQ